MPCAVKRCSNAMDLVLTLDHCNISTGLCRNHWVDAVKRVTGETEGRVAISGEGRAVPVPAITDPYLHDYVRLYAILNSEELFLAEMKKFTNEVSRAAKKKIPGKWWRTNSDTVAVGLSSSLSRYEQLCWFGRQQKIMSGLLTKKEFLGAIENGLMVKDPGPGPDHGEYSHRLQWQYIMRVVTKGFTTAKTADWKLTPLQMYCGMAKAGAEHKENVWGALLEGAAPFMGTAGSPDWVNRQFRDANGGLHDTSFGASLTRRYDRRMAMVTKVQEEMNRLAADRAFVNRMGRIASLVDAEQDLLGPHARPGGGAVGIQITVETGLPPRPRKAWEPQLHTVVEFLYKWKKAGRGARLPASASLEMIMAWQIWDDTYAQKYEGRDRQFFRAQWEGSNDEISEGLLLHQSEGITDGPIADRLNSSREGLNPAFKFGSSFGAEART